jgi:hypothetical protein
MALAVVLLATTLSASTHLNPAPIAVAEAAVNEPALQTGSFRFTQTGDRWASVRFADTFSVTPVVVVSPPSWDEKVPAAVRVRNITTSGFEVQVFEWPYQDGLHVQQDLTYVAMEPGIRQLGAVTVQAISITAQRSWFRQYFAQTMHRPVVLSQVSSTNSSWPFTTRLRGVNAESFQIRLQSDEAHSNIDSTEIVGVIALDSGAGVIDGQSVRVGRAPLVPSSWRQLGATVSGNERVLAAHQTVAGSDPVGLHLRTESSGAVRARLQEERSADEETTHRGERVGWLVIPQGISTHRVAGEAIDLFFVAGQSNASQRLDNFNPSSLDTSVRYYYQSGMHRSLDGWTSLGSNDLGLWGLDVPLGRQLVADHSDVAIINVSAGSKSLFSDWNAPLDGDMWRRWKTEVSVALAELSASGKPVRLRGFFWMQGEADAWQQPKAAAYQTNFANFVTAVDGYLEFLGYPVDQMVHVTAGISGRVFADTVNSAQLNVMAANANGHWVPTDDLARGDEVHFTDDGLDALGARMAAAYRSNA